MNCCPNGIIPPYPRTDSNYPHDTKSKIHEFDKTLQHLGITRASVEFKTKKPKLSKVVPVNITKPALLHQSNKSVIDSDVSRDFRFVYSLDSSQKVTVYDLNGNEITTTLSLPNEIDLLQDAKFFGDGRHLAILGDLDHIHLFDLQKMEAVGSLAVSEEGELLFDVKAGFSNLEFRVNQSGTRAISLISHHGIEGDIYRVDLWNLQDKSHIRDVAITDSVKELVEDGYDPRAAYFFMRRCIHCVKT